MGPEEVSKQNATSVLGHSGMGTRSAQWHHALHYLLHPEDCPAAEYSLRPGESRCIVGNRRKCAEYPVAGDNVVYDTPNCPPIALHAQFCILIDLLQIPLFQGGPLDPLVGLFEVPAFLDADCFSCPLV